MWMCRGMNQQRRRQKFSRRKCFGAIGGLVAALLGVSFAMPLGVGADTLDIENATFEWDVNIESNIGALNGSCNYLSAGESDGSASTYNSVDGNATVVKLTADDTYEPISNYTTRCNDKDGVKVPSNGSRSLGQKVVYSNGVGTVNTVTGEAEISWQGTFSVTFYGSLLPFWLIDPSVQIDADGNGMLMADVGGYASTIENPDVRDIIDPVEDVVIGTFTGVDSANEGGVILDFDYESVEYTSLQGAPQLRPEDRVWGAWPSGFVDIMAQLGMGEFWYTTGTSTDRFKAPNPGVIGYGEGTIPTTTTTTTIPVTVPSVTFPTTSTTTPRPTTTTTAVPQTPAPAPQGSNEQPQVPIRPSNGPGSSVQRGSQHSTQNWNTRRSNSNSSRLNNNANRQNRDSMMHRQNGRGGSSLSETGIPAVQLDDVAPNHLGWSVDISQSSIQLAADSANAGKYVGSLPEITIRDARGGSPWVVSGQISNDTSKLGKYFGWVPQIRSGGQGVVPGEVVKPGNGSKTLTNPSLLATATAGSNGTVTIGADLELTLPQGTSVGDQPTMLTITALG